MKQDRLRIRLERLVLLSACGLLGLGGAPACGGKATEGTSTGGLAGAPTGAGGQLAGSGAAEGAGGSTGGGSGGGPDIPVIAVSDFECEPGVPPTPTVRLLNWHYDNTVRDLLGVTGLDAFDGAAPSAILNPDHPGPLTAYSEAAYHEVASAIALQVMAGSERERFISCDPNQVECLTSTIAQFGRKAFRRPLSAEELDSLESLIPADLDGQGEGVAQEILSTMLGSPHFIERRIVGGAPDAQGAFALTSHELAVRLSYALWGTTPDDVLSAAADAGALQTEEQIRAQAERMLTDARAADGVWGAARLYLGLDYASHWFAVEHDPAVFPDYSESVGSDAAAELEVFFEEVTLSGGTFSDLFLSNQGYVTAGLALIYGLPADAFGAELTPTPLDANERPGFLSRAAFLSSYSSPGSTNPMLRGAFVTSRVLGMTLPPPPSEPILTPPPQGVYTTQRAYVEALTAPTPCFACHEDYVNPPGFALENYDAIGSWQTIDPKGGPIDPAADVFLGAEVRSVETPLELMQGLAESLHARRNYVDQLVAYAFERSPNPQDACVGDSLMDLITQDSAPLLELWLRLTTHEAFRLGAVAPE